MNKVFLLLVLCMSLLSCQTKRDKEINIPGTRLSINVPQDFKVSEGFIGLEKNKTCLIQIYDLIGGNHLKNQDSFSREIFEKGGAKVFQYKEFELDGFPAKYIFMQLRPDQIAMSLVFGDSTFSDMVMAVFPSNDKMVEEQIRKALFSIKYDKNLKINPLASTFFVVEKNDSKFKFAKASANIFLYSRNGAIKDSYHKEAMFTITTFASDETTPKEILIESMLTGMKQNGFIEIKQDKISEESINGYDAYEREVSGYLKGSKVLIYQLILVQNNRAIGIQGITYSEFENDLTEFKKLSRSIKFK